MPSPFWIFGYGSLVWRPAFAFEDRAPAHVRGFARRFYQGSTDHRGVPGAPGRVVTLIREEDTFCHGMAYRVGDADRDAVIAQLDHREKGGYERVSAAIHLPHREVDGVFYVATEDNDNWLGPAPLEEIAAQVLRSRGPSGHNVEYVKRLAAALRELGVDDPHVFELAALL